MKLEKYSGNPILSPNPKQPWESLVVCNPGVIYDRGTFYMLYRCAGNDAQHVIRFGLATSKDGLHPDMVAPMFGFSSGEQLLLELTGPNADTAQKIEGMTRCCGSWPVKYQPLLSLSHPYRRRIRNCPREI